MTMRHIACIFIGSGAMNRLAEDVMKYTLMFGGVNLPQYLTAWSLQSKDGLASIKAYAIDESKKDPYLTDLENSLRVSERAIKENGEWIDVRQALRKLRSSKINIQHQSDAHSSSQLAVNIVVNIGNDADVDDTLHLVADMPAKDFKVDIICILPDLYNSIEGKDEDIARSIDESRQRTMLNLKRLQSVITEYADTSLRHVILVDNRNDAGYDLNLNYDNFVRLVSEYSISLIENHDTIYHINSENPEDIFYAFGFSAIYFDKYYFIDYLTKCTYQRLIEKERPDDIEVNVNDIAARVHSIIEPFKGTVAKVWDESVSKHIDSKVDSRNYIGEISNAIKDEYICLSDKIIELITDDNLSLPEKQVAIALLLDDDDDYIKGNEYSSNTSLFDLDKEPVEFFIELNNKYSVTKEVIKDNNETKEAKQEDNSKINEKKQEENKIIYHPGIITEPIDDKCHAYLPLDGLKKLNKLIRQSKEVIRKKEEEIAEIQKVISDQDFVKRNIETDITVEPHDEKDNVFGFLRGVPERPLDGVQYIPHQVKEESISLRDDFTSVKNQGENNACSAFSLTSIMEYILKKNGEPKPDLSEMYLYYNARKLAQSEGENAGLSFSDTVKALMDTGICTEEKWPEESDYSIQPSDDAYEDGKSRRLTEVQTVNISIDDFKSAISDGYPIAFSLKIFDSFKSAGDKGLVPFPTEEEIKAFSQDTQGNHAMVIVGFSDEARMFEVRNSWGKDWGDNGYCYIPYSFLEADIIQGDKMVNPCACIITKISVEKLNVKGVVKRKAITFNQADNNIRLFIKKSLLFEEKYNLEKFTKQHAALYTKYSMLVERLDNKRMRDELEECANKSLEKRIQRCEESIKYIKDVEINEGREKHKKKTWKTIKRWMLCCMLPYVLLTLICYLVRLLRLFIPLKVFDIALFLFIAALIGTVIYYFYRKHIWQQKERALKQRIKRLNDEIAGYEKEKRELSLRAYINGEAIEHLKKIRTDLHSRYTAIKHFIHKCVFWKKNDFALVEKDQTLNGRLFVPILSNSVLNDFFDDHKDEWTKDLHLYDFLTKDKDYELTEDGLHLFKRNLKDKIEKYVLSEVSSFRIINYISMIINGDKVAKDKYSYLSQKEEDISDFLRHVENNATPFLDCSRSAPEMFESSQYIFTEIKDSEIGDIEGYLSRYINCAEISLTNNANQILLMNKRKVRYYDIMISGIPIFDIEAQVAEKEEQQNNEQTTIEYENE